ncbi:MAG: hypothetical protein AB1689_05035, partial [Thermodesulfobacteriota bacterium]
IRTTFGERWPAAHPNNVMQLFRRAPRTSNGSGPAALAALAASGRTHAVQLELGAPLRFPGAWRERFLVAAVATFGRRASVRDLRGDAADELAGPLPRASAAGPSRGVALQAHDPSASGDGLGIVAGVGPLGGDEIGGRLLLLPGGQRLLLFTGHGRRRDDGRLVTGGLEAVAFDGTTEVRFRGPLLDIPDGALYFRDEAAQLAARVRDAEVELRFAARGDGGFGTVAGRVRLDDTVLRVDAQGFTDPVLARFAPDHPGVRLRLTASFGADLGLVADLAPEPGAASLAARGAADRAPLAFDGDVVLPDVPPARLAAPFRLPLRGGGALRCAPRAHVTILRALRPGLFARVTFGVASYALGERLGSGFYEHTTAFAAAPGASGQA